MTDEEMFFAWLDGELDRADAARVEARVAADPELQQLAEQHRSLGSRLRSAFDPIAAQPVPEPIPTALHAPPVIDFAAKRDRRRKTGGVPQWAALAATLAIGVLTGVLIGGTNGASPVTLRGGSVYAAGTIDHALDQQLASAGGEDEVRIGLTFRNQDGAICRSFTGPASSGLACRDADGWRLRGLFAAPEGQQGDYRMASGGEPAMAELIGSTIAGEPFDAKQEADAKKRGWR